VTRKLNALIEKEINEMSEALEMAKGIIEAQSLALAQVDANVISNLIDACVAAYIDNPESAAASQLKAAVLAATGKTPEEIAE
jgi:hypothetical protein